jgi:hypothetical protein
MIGVLRWGVEIGQPDILLDVALKSADLACPREGHLEAAFHMLGYLRGEPARKIAIDPGHPKIDQRNFYRDAEEPIPPNAPPSRGKEVSTHCVVDANLAGSTVTRRSQMGTLLIDNKVPDHLIEKENEHSGVKYFWFEDCCHVECSGRD